MAVHQFDPNLVEASHEFDPSLIGEAPRSTTSRVISDLGKSLKSGVEQLPGQLTGLADVAPALAFGARPFSKAADYVGEATGFQPGKWAKDIQYSPENAQSQAEIDQAWKDANPDLAGVAKVGGAYLRNPAYSANQVAQSVPGMVAGGVGARALMTAGRVAGAGAGTLERMVGEKFAAPIAGGVGEGAQQTGQQMDQGSDNPDQRKNAIAALASGGIDAAIGAGAGRVANALGFETAQTAMAGGTRTRKTLSRGKAIAGGITNEALLQEAPQSAQEQAWQNYAEGKPLGEGVARNAVEGAIAGGVMGGGVNILGGHAEKPAPQPGPVQESQPPTAPLALPAPTITVSPTGEAMTADQRQAQRGDVTDVEPHMAPTPAEAMGLDASAGPLSAAAIHAVNSGLTQSLADAADAQAAADEQAKGKDQTEGTFKTSDEAKKYISSQKRAGGASIQALPMPKKDGSFGIAIKGSPDYEIATFHQKQETLRAAGVLDGDILNKSGDIFPPKQRGLATITAKRSGPGYEAAPVTGGFVVRRVTQSDSKAAKTVIKANKPKEGKASAQTAKAIQNKPQAPAAQASEVAQPVAQPSLLEPASVQNQPPPQTGQQAQAAPAPETPASAIGERPAAEAQAEPSAVEATGVTRNARQVAIDSKNARVEEQQTKRRSAQAEASKPMEGLSVGSMPTNAEPVTVKDGVVHIGKYPAQNFETGEDIKVPAGASPAQIAAALKESGAMGKRARVFGLQQAAVAPAPRQSEASMPPAPGQSVPTESLGKSGPERSKSGDAARARAMDANPFKAFIAKHGITSAVASEFAPGNRERQSAMVQGYGPIFRKTGKDLDRLAQNAVEEGFLKEHDVAQLSSMIHDVLAGKRHIAQYAQGVAETEMAARAARADEIAQEADQAQNSETEAEAQAEREAIRSLGEVSHETLQGLADDEHLLTAGNNTSEADFLRALGASEQEISDATAKESARASQGDQGRAGAEETATGATPRGTEGSSGPELAKEPTPDYTGNYETDLFGDPVPTPTGSNRPARPAGAGLRGNAQPSPRVRDTQAPAGEYHVNTIIGTESSKEIGTDRVTTAAQAAQATQYLYKSAVERFDAIVTDKNGKPLAIVGGFKGDINQTSVYPATVMGEAIRIPGAAKIWFSHNHPSGQSTLSRADEMLSGSLADLFRGSGIEPMGLLAIGDGKFSFVYENNVLNRREPIPESTTKATIPVMDRQLGEKNGRGAAINSPEAAKDAARVYYGKAKEPGIMLLDSQYGVVGWVPITQQMMGPLRGTGGAAAIYRAVSQSNAAAAIIVHGGELDTRGNLPAGVSARENIAAALAKVGAKPLDSINAVTGKSAAETGLKIADGPMFALGNAETSDLARTIGPARGMTATAVQKVVDSVTAKWKNGPRIVVAQTTNDLPSEVKARVLGNSRGIYTRDAIYIVAGNNTSADMVARTLAHEAIAHHGLRGMLGPMGHVQLMRRIHAGIAAGDKLLIASQTFVRKTYANANLSAKHEADEIAAHVVEMAVDQVTGEFKPGYGWLKMIFARIAAFLRKIGIDVKFTTAELHGMLVSSMKNLEAGQRTRGGGELVVAAARREDVHLQAVARGANEAVRVGDVFRTPTGEAVTALRQKPGGVMEVRIQGKKMRLGDFKNNELKAWDKIGRADYADGAYTTPQSLIDLAKNEPTAPESDGAQTDTPAFKKWFGDSKVVDADGKPLVVYHGTQNPWNVHLSKDERLALFDKNTRGVPKSIVDQEREYMARGAGAVWLTESESVADGYADGGEVMQVYASIKNPLDLRPDTVGIDKVQTVLEDVGLGRASDAYGWDKGVAQAIVWDNTKLIDYARKNGFDGLIYPDTDNMGRYTHTSYVALNPGQIKSATGNRGTFDASNPDILMALGTPAGVSDFANGAVERINSMISAPGKVNWWHKSLGTMYNLAERAPAFKPVFEAAQNFINDVSFYATEAADMAPRILPKLETWADIKKSPITAVDNKAVSAPIFEGTLSWARDEAGKPVKVDELEAQAATLSPDQKAQRLLRNDKITEQVLKMWRGLPVEQFDAMVETRFKNEMLKPGVVFTDAELKSLFNLTPEQIGLYREFRTATDKSLDNLAKADMLRYGGEDVKALRDQVMAAEDADAAGVLLRDYLLSLAKEDPSRNDVLITTATGMIDRADKIKALKNEGYAPLSRFGQYTVDVVVDGERQYFSLFESAHDANTMANKMRMLYGKDAVTQGTLSNEAFKLFAGITPESLELFGNMLGLDSTGDQARDKVFQDYLKLTKTNRSAMRRLIHRKGIAGYSEDAGRVLASFIYSNARQTSAALHMGDLGEAITEIPKQQGELTDVAVKLSDYIKNPQEEAHAVRGLLFAQYLGGSIASAAVNMTQPLAVSLPYLSQFGGVVQSGRELARAYRDMAKKNPYEHDLAIALKHAEETGIVSPQEVHQLMAQARGSGSLKSGDGTRAGNALAAGSNALSRLSLAWGKVFGMAEQLNRRTTFIAAYRIAKAQNMADPAGFAEKAVNETQFVYCVDGETECLTVDGWKKRNELQPGAVLVGIDATGKAIETLLVDVHRFPGRHQVTQFSNATNFSMVVTDGHDSVVQNYDSRMMKWGLPLKRNTVELKDGHQLMRVPNAQIDRPASIGNDMATLLGWVAAEGNYAKFRSCTARTNVRLTQSLKHNQEYVAEIEALLQRLGGHYRKFSVKNGDMAIFTLKRPLSDAVRKLMPDKLLDWSMVKTMSASEMRAVLDAFSKGDGTLIQNGGWCIGQKIEKSLHVLQAMSAMVGQNATLYPARATEDGKVAHLYLHKNSKRTMVKQLDRQVAFVEDGVWCPETEAGTWIARRNGAIFVTGNSKANKMQFGRGAIGGTLMTFKTYTVSYLELMHRMYTQGGPEGKKAALLGIAVLMLLSGAGGLPFAEDVEDLVDGMLQRLGYNISSKKAKQEFLEDIFGKAGAEFVNRGITGLPGVPLDVSGRLGMGNLLPGTGLLTEKRSHAGDIGEFVGPMGDFVKRLYEGGGQLLSGDVGKAALTVAPTAVRNVAKGAGMATTGMYRDDKGYKVLDTTMTEAAFKSIGFQPALVAKVQESNYLTQKAKDFYNATAQDIRARWAKGIFEKDPEQVAQARAMLDAWNRDNPDQHMTANLPAILKKAREMAKSKDQRIADTAPKAMRSRLRDELAQRRAEAM